MRPARSSLAACLFGLVLAGPGMSAAEPDADEASANAPAPLDIEWKFGTGFDYSVGDYGLEDDTKLFYVPLSIQATLDRWRVRASLPLLFLDGPTGLQNDAGGGTRTVSMSPSGLGQFLLSGSYLFGSSASSLPYLETSLKVNAPTETDDALGTGLWAASVQIDLFDRFGRFTPFARFGRKFYEGSRLRDRFYTSVGSSVQIREGFSAGVAYDWYQSTTADVRDIHQISPFATLRVRDFAFGPYAVVGLSEGAPDYGVGFSISVRR